MYLFKLHNEIFIQKNKLHKSPYTSQPRVLAKFKAICEPDAAASPAGQARVPHNKASPPGSSDGESAENEDTHESRPDRSTKEYHRNKRSQGVPSPPYQRFVFRRR